MAVRRRSFLRGAVGAAAGMLGGFWAARAEAQHGHHEAPAPGGRSRPPAPTAHSTTPGAPPAVTVLDVPKLPFETDGGVKVFRLVAEPVTAEFLPGQVFDVWGYNGSNPGPTIEVTEGDRVRILFENRLPEPTTVHWHGLEVPIETDGIPAISQPLVMPGERFTYEFTVRQNGTFFYHTHMAMQEMLGLLGFFIIHPKAAHEPAVHKNFNIVLQEWAVLPHNTVPNTLSMEFNWLTFNDKAGPAATPMLVRLGERVRIRLINIGMDHHPIHLHGMQFTVTGTEAGRVPPSAWYPQNTVLVGVAQARDIEFEATYPSDWMLHCHLPHHMMNAMVSMVGPMAHGGPRVPGFPQDMWMPRDAEVTKAETYGLPDNWSAALGGMMTLVRVLPPDRYDEIMARVKAAGVVPTAPPADGRSAPAPPGRGHGH